MRFSFSQDLKQEQRQVLSQRMIQAMEILQLPLMELQERIETEMEQNPLLELDDTTPETQANPETHENEAEGPRETVPDDTGILKKVEVEPNIVLGESPNLQDDFRIADEYAANYADTIDESPARSQNWLEKEEERRSDAIANIPFRSETLQEYLVEQLSWFDLEPDLYNMLERIIYNLNPSGFLPGPLKDVLGAKATSEELRLAQKAMEIIRKLDPPGVGSQGIKECLLLQITPEIANHELLKTLITDHIEDIEHNRLPLISKKTGFTIAAIQEALQELRKLNPIPSTGFSERSAPRVIADIVVDVDEEGNFVIRIEEGEIPRLRISNYYRELMQQQDTDKDTKNYIKQKVGSAQWLIDSIKQRQSTLTKVAQEIVEHQTEFLQRGPIAIKPLKMQQIADKIGVHVTTVSRACDDKWMQTPQGLFPLKRFFASAVQAVDGKEDVAQDAVRIKLQELIDQEDKSKPLSDEELVKQLEQAGYKIARRTIVKYRQIMNIPSSRERKDWS